MLELRWDRNGEGEGSRYTYMIAAEISGLSHIIIYCMLGGKLYH